MQFLKNQPLETTSSEGTLYEFNIRVDSHTDTDRIESWCQKFAIGKWHGNFYCGKTIRLIFYRKEDAQQFKHQWMN